MKNKFKNDEQLREMAQMMATVWMSKESICKNFNLENRQMRLKVAEIANVLPVISSSQRAGYKVATDSDSIEDLLRADKDLELKIKALQLRRKPLQREIRRRKVEESKIA